MRVRALCLLLGLLVTGSAHADGPRMPRKVAAALDAQWPDARVESATRVGARYALVLLVHGVQVRAVYTRTGTWIEAVSPVDPTAVPAAVLDASAAFGHLLDVARVDLPEPAASMFELLVFDRADTIRLRLDAQGRVVSHEVLPPPPPKRDPSEDKPEEPEN